MVDPKIGDRKFSNSQGNYGRPPPPKLVTRSSVTVKETMVDPKKSSVTVKETMADPKTGDKKFSNSQGNYGRPKIGDKKFSNSQGNYGRPQNWWQEVQ